MSNSIETIDMSLSNFYGTVYAKTDGVKYWMELGDWGGTDEVEISKSLYELIKKEFSMQGGDDTDATKL